MIPRLVGKHELLINKLTPDASDYKVLHDRIDLTRLEITAGIVEGIIAAAAINRMLA